MGRVAQVLEIDLPVAVIGLPEHAAGDLDLAVGRAIDHVVERGGHVAERFLEARSVARTAREDEAAVALHPRHRQHGHFGIFRIEALRVTVIERHRLDPTVEVIGPTVIAAGEFRRVALVGRHDHGAAVGALVVDHTHRSLVIAHQNDRLAPHVRGEIIAGLFDLALVPDIEPGGAKDAFHLEVEGGGTGVEPTVHAPGRDQASKLGIDVVHRLTPRSLPCGRGGDHSYAVGPGSCIVPNDSAYRALLPSPPALRTSPTCPSGGAMPFSCAAGSPISSVPPNRARLSAETAATWSEGRGGRTRVAR